MPHQRFQKLPQRAASPRRAATASVAATGITQANTIATGRTRATSNNSASRSSSTATSAERDDREAANVSNESPRRSRRRESNRPVAEARVERRRSTSSRAPRGRRSQPHSSRRRDRSEEERNDGYNPFTADLTAEELAALEQLRREREQRSPPRTYADVAARRHSPAPSTPPNQPPTPTPGGPGETPPHFMRGRDPFSLTFVSVRTIRTTKRATKLASLTSRGPMRTTLQRRPLGLPRSSLLPTPRTRMKCYPVMPLSSPPRNQKKLALEAPL